MCNRAELVTFHIIRRASSASKYTRRIYRAVIAIYALVYIYMERSFDLFLNSEHSRKPQRLLFYLLVRGQNKQNQFS